MSLQQPALSRCLLALGKWCMQRLFCGGLARTAVCRCYTSIQVSQIRIAWAPCIAAEHLEGSPSTPCCAGGQRAPCSAAVGTLSLKRHHPCTPSCSCMPGHMLLLQTAHCGSAVFTLPVTVDCPQAGGSVCRSWSPKSCYAERCTHWLSWLLEVHKAAVVWCCAQLLDNKVLP